MERLNPDQIVRIYVDFHSGVKTALVLAAEFDVSNKTITNITKERTYAHVPKPIITYPCRKDATCQTPPFDNKVDRAAHEKRHTSKLARAKAKEKIFQHFEEPDQLTLFGYPADEKVTTERIQSIYRSRALEVHPDKTGGSTEAFQQLAARKEYLLQADPRNLESQRMCYQAYERAKARFHSPDEDEIKARAEMDQIKARMAYMRGYVGTANDEYRDLKRRHKELDKIIQRKPRAPMKSWRDPIKEFM